MIIKQVPIKYQKTGCEIQSCYISIGIAKIRYSDGSKNVYTAEEHGQDTVDEIKLLVESGAMNNRRDARLTISGGGGGGNKHQSGDGGGGGEPTIVTMANGSVLVASGGDGGKGGGPHGGEGGGKKLTVADSKSHWPKWLIKVLVAIGLKSVGGFL